MKRFITKHYSIIIKFYQKLFVKKKLYFYNKVFYDLALRGMGILNYEDSKISGEEYFLKRFFKKYQNPVIFDIGANIGNYSKKCVEINKYGLIYAFEPHPISYKSLFSLSRTLDFKAFNLGIGDKDEKITIYDYQDKQGSEHASFHKLAIKSENLCEYETEVITLDNFIRNNNVQKIDLLKIDTEGNELNVLKGAQNSINSLIIGIIQFEFNEMNLVSKASFKDFLNILDNYYIFRLLPDGMVEIAYSSIECEIYAYQNIVAVRKDIDF